MCRVLDRTQRFLFQEHEHSVNQLNVFGEIVQLLQSAATHVECSGTNIVQRDQGLRPSSSSITNRKEYAIPPYGRKQLFNEQRQKCSTDDGQVQVVYHEQAIQVQRFPMLHEFSTSKHGNIVCRQQDHRRLQGRYWGLSGDEFEVCGRITQDGGV